MDFTKKTRQRVQIKPEVETLEKMYPHNLMLYRLPPTGEITLQDFEELALERLKVLRIFEYATSKNLKILSDEWKSSITSELNREGLKGYTRLIQGGGSKKELDLQARKRDYLSHFILRLAYCRSEELRRWFVAREMELFRMKFANLTPQEIKEYLELYNLKYTPLTESQKKEVATGLMESTFGQSIMRIDNLEFYKVTFTEVLDLVRQRKCYLKDGFAYVNANDFVSVVSAIHQNEIVKGLAATLRMLPEVENDERIYYLVKGLHTSYTGKDYTISKGAGVPIECIDQLSKKSFPLCMRMCHEAVRTKHHLKHGGRMQYGLFLKGIGVSLEDSLRFWRDEFTKMMDLDKFEKSYAYNVRHNYGKEGSRVNYSPYSCLKIITAAIGPQDVNGCPFKLYDAATLKSKLNSYGIAHADTQDIASFAAKGHYQVACTRYFEAVHNLKSEQGIQHPNQYFEISQNTMNTREPQTSTPGRKKIKRVFKQDPDSTLFDNQDDMELWDVVETQETQFQDDGLKLSSDPKDLEKNMWSDDFDLSQVTDVDF